MTPRNTFRVAVRKFGPFESAIQKQWDSFNSVAQTGLTLEAVAFDLQPLAETLFEREGLLRGDWDVAFMDTDWLPLARASRAVMDLAQFVKADPPRDFPSGWSDSLLRLQTIEGEILGLPYHDGPECLIYRKDLFEDPQEQQAYQRRFGSPLRVPQTWTEFRQVAAFFQRPQENLFPTATIRFTIFCCNFGREAASSLTPPANFTWIRRNPSKRLNSIETFFKTHLACIQAARKWIRLNADSLL
jgi:multiple sugar transport system substrate-binding protein